VNTFLLINLLLWILVVPLAVRAETSYQRLIEIKPGQGSLPLPSLSIIIPARNEALVLPKVLASLKNQKYPAPLEIIVVDDNSHDQTALIAESFEAKVIKLRELPAGWLGKPHACQRGAEAASGDWLLFTDADTIHQSQSAVSAVNFALKNSLDGLSLFLKNITSGWIDAAVLGVAFTGLFAGWGSMTSMFNGQFILVKKSVYFDSGGFASVRHAPVEDVAFGKRLQEMGYRAPVGRGESLASVHMYRSISQLWHGLTRLGSGSLNRSPWSAFLMVIFLEQLTSPLTYLANSLFGSMNWIFPFIAWIAVFLIISPWMNRIRSTGVATLAPLGAVFVIFAAIWGLIQRATGLGNRWKGRRV
jgi:chlorobactene glucosyltransferase